MPIRIDDAFDQLHMPKSPAHDQFVEFREALTHVDPMAILMFVAIESKDSARTRPEAFLLGRTLVDIQLANTLKRSEEGIVQRRFTEPALQLRVRFWSWLMIAEHFLVLESAKELQLAELFGLESAGRFQLAPECKEVRRQHGFENRELLDQYAGYLGATPKQPRSFVDLICD